MQHQHLIQKVVVTVTLCLKMTITHAATKDAITNIL